MLESQASEPRPIDDLPTADSVERALAFQRAERLQAARDMGVPSHLVDLYDVSGFDDMERWIKLIHEAMQR